MRKLKRILLSFTLFVVLGFTGACAYLGGGSPADQTEKIGTDKEINVAVYDDRSEPTHRNLTSPVLIESLETTVTDVLTNLDFTVIPGSRGSGYSLLASITRAEFKTTSAFGNVRLMIGASLFCRSPSNRYETELVLRRDVPPDRVQLARENPTEVITEQYKAARRDLVRKIFDEKTIVTCLSDPPRDGNPPRPSR